MKYIEEKQGGTVIDLGCGKGNNSLFLKERGYNVIACDFSPVAIEFINKTNPLIDTMCFDMISEFPNNIKNGDVVLASLSTHYFSLNDTINLYGNIRNILNLTGYFIFRVNSKKELEDRDKPYIKSMIEKDYYLLNDGSIKRYFDIDSISTLLEGFTIIKINEDSSEYHGKKKYYIDGVVQKI